MLTNVLPAPRPHARPPHPQTHNDGQDAKSSHWWRRGLSVIGVVALVATLALLISHNRSSRGTGPKLTHKVTRGDLVVKVTAQGLLESAENTEIKCEVRGRSTVTWVIESGTIVSPGDELVRLDTLAIEDAVNERSKYAHWSRSAAERARANMATATLAIPAYEEGTYRANLMRLQKDLAVAESDLRSARSMLSHAQMLAERDYVSELVVEGRTFAVTQTELDVQVKKNQVDLLTKYTKAMEVQTRTGNLKAAKATLAAAEERAKMDAARRDLAMDELTHCVIKAERSGLVIYPSAAKWRSGPEIEEGARVYKEQVLLLMPDLAQMQVKVGIHESIVERVKPGQIAKVTLPDKTIEGVVASVATVTRPASWWTGNAVKYDTLIDLPSIQGLRPGMSAEVEVTTAQHVDVLTIPVAAVVATDEGDFCWVKTADGPKRRSIRLGDTNDSFVIVKAGLKEGDEVVLNPYAFREESKNKVRKPVDAQKQAESKSTAVDAKKKRQESESLESKPQKPKSPGSKPLGSKPLGSKPKITKPSEVKDSGKPNEGKPGTTT